MYAYRHSYLTGSTLNNSATTTETTFQPANRTTYLSKSEEVMTGNSGDKQLDENQRKPVFHKQFKEDLEYWKKTQPNMLKRIRNLIEGIVDDPYKGIGKPEPLKYMGADVWSRRINDEHRIIYLVSADQIDFLQARYHYEK